MKIKKEVFKIKPELKMSEEFLDLRTAEKNIILQKLDENIKLRELPVDKRFKKQIEQF